MQRASLFFFFSSRRRHTRFDCDWSSDVCSSDLSEHPVQDRMLGGVAAGIARYLSVDVTVVRIVFAVLAIMGGAGIPLYLAGWLLIPEEDTEQSIASDLIQSLSSRSR